MGVQRRIHLFIWQKCVSVFNALPIRTRLLATLYLRTFTEKVWCPLRGNWDEHIGPGWQDWAGRMILASVRARMSQGFYSMCASPILAILLKDDPSSAWSAANNDMVSRFRAFRGGHWTMARTICDTHVRHTRALRPTDWDAFHSVVGEFRLFSEIIILQSVDNSARDKWMARRLIVRFNYKA